MSLLDTAKHHPYWIGAGVFVVGLVVIYGYAHSGSSAQTVSVGPTPQDLQAEVQLAGIQAGAAANTANTNAQLSALTAKNANDLAIATLGQTVSLASLTNEKDIAKINADVTTSTAGQQLQAALAQIAGATQTAHEQTAAQIAIVDAQTAQNEFIAQQQTQLQTDIAANQFNLGAAQINENFQAANLNAVTAQHIADLQEITSGEQIASNNQIAGLQTITANQQIAAGVTAQTLQSQSSQFLATIQAAIANATIQGNVDIANITAGTNAKQVQANVDIANVNATANTAIANANATIQGKAIDASLQSHYYDDLLSYFNTQTVANAQTSIAKSAASSSTSNAFIGGAFGLLGKLFG